MSATRPRFDPTINLGHIFTFLGYLVVAAGAYYGMRAELGTVTLRLEVVEKQIDKMASVVVQGARQDERMNQIERRLDKIERLAR